MATIPGKKPKHVEAREYVERLIASGKYRTGDRLPSENDLVDRFQASRPTVARALRELQLLGLVERRAGSGTYVKEREPARGSPAVASQAFGLLIPELGQTEIFEPICGQLARQAQDQGHVLLWGDFGSAPRSTAAELTADPSARAEQACRSFLDQQVAGVFFAPIEHSPVGGETSARILRALDAAGVPVVLLDRDVVGFPQRSPYDLVGIDNLRGGFGLTQHLLTQGRRRICFVARPHSAPTIERRVAGYREALWQAGREVRATNVCVGDPGDLATVRRWLTVEQPDACVCANDITAAALLQSLSQLGRRVPDDVAVVGFDDVKYARLLGVPLTTMRQPCAELGQVAFSTMLERIARPLLPPRTILLDPELVVRQSCGAPRTAT